MSETNPTAARVEVIAHVCHEVVRALAVTHGDGERRPWDQLPAETQAAVRAHVAFRLANPDFGDSARHDQWCAERYSTGWVHGPVEAPNAEPPTHPNLMPYADLPADKRIRHRLFRVTCETAAAAFPAE